MIPSPLPEMANTWVENGQFGRCLYSSRNCLPFRTTRVHPRLFGGFRIVHSYTFAFIFICVCVTFRLIRVLEFTVSVDLPFFWPFNLLSLSHFKTSILKILSHKIKKETHYDYLKGKKLKFGPKPSMTILHRRKLKAIT